MFSFAQCSKTARLALEKVAYQHWLITRDIFIYFQKIAKENRAVYEERFVSFTKLIEALNASSLNNIILLLEESIKRFGKGYTTTRYADLLRKMQVEVEKYGPTFFAYYCAHIDWNAQQFPELNQCAATSYYQVYSQHKKFVENILSSFFAVLEKYIKETQQEIDEHRSQVYRYVQKDSEPLIQSGIRFLKGEIMQPFLTVAFNEKLALKKICLLSRLKCNLLELMDDKSQQDNINGFILGLCFHLYTCRDDNEKLVLQEKYSSKGAVDEILSNMLICLLKYYPAESAIAEGWYEDYVRENKQEIL